MSLPPRQPGSGPFISTSRRPRGRRRAVGALVIAASAVAVCGLALGGLWLAERDTLPARTEIAGVEVGGRTHTAARLLVAETAERRLREPVELSSDGVSIEVTGTQLGAKALVDDAVVEAQGVGLLQRLARRLGFGETRTVDLRYTLRPEQINRLVSELDRRLSVEPVDAELTVKGTTTTVTPSREGRKVATGRLTALLRTLPQRVPVPVRTVQPQVTTPNARKAQRLADRLLEQPRRVAVGNVSTTLSPAVLARAIVVAPANGRIELSLDSAVLRKRLQPTFRTLERPAADATLRVEGSRVSVVPARSGRELDVDRIGRSLIANLDSVAHRARFVETPPAVTTEQIEMLKITELVSEFVTYYPCCAPRVTNIQRAATLLDGTILRPGETFSLNDALGQRTVEKGFVAAPQILAGRLEDAVGGGISQVATTLYNAAFFAGLRLDAHQPHEFYISRYPMGREATVSWRSPELIFTNDWPAGLLMKLSASDTGIAIRFYSSKLGRRVATTTGDPYAPTAPRTITSKNPSLKPGERKVIQDAGASGFTVQYTRKVWRGSKLKRDEVFTVRYRPQNSYVEIGPPKKPKKKPPKKPGAPGEASPAAPDDGEAPGDGVAPGNGSQPGAAEPAQ